MRFCEKCGAEIPKDAKFCEKCGASVEPEFRENKGGDSHKKWIIGGIVSGIFIVAVVVVSLFATGVLGGDKETVQTVTDVIQSDTGGSDATVQPTEQTVITPVITSSPAPEPTETPVGSDEPEELMDARTPEETYKRYIETFVEAVNTGNTDGLGKVLSGKIYKQQCELVGNYYKRGIQEELKSYSISSIKKIDESCTKVNTKETIKVFYKDGSSKTVDQEYSYVCKYLNSMWLITSMKDIKK